MPELHETLMGRKLIEGTLPDIARQLKRIGDVLENKSGGQVTLDIYELVNNFPDNTELGEQLRTICQTKQILPIL
jgi:hypothetical protein